jgi:hypothetical protein
MAAKPKESRAAFIAWLWAQQAAIVALAQEQARNVDEGYDIAMHALTEAIEGAGKTGGVVTRGAALQALRSRVQQLCVEYRAQRTRLTAKDNFRRRGEHRGRAEHNTVGLRRVEGADMARVALHVASDASIWEEMSTQFLPVYTREGPGPCNLCGRMIWWTALNWGARKGGARWMRKWEVLGMDQPGSKPRAYSEMQPSGRRHICGVMDKPHKLRYEAVVLPLRRVGKKS